MSVRKKSSSDTQNNKRSPRELIVRLAIDIFFVFSIICLIGMLISYSRAEDPDDVNLFGFKPLIIISQSMYPEIEVSGMVIIKKVPFDELKVGDIISFKVDSPVLPPDQLNTHRIIEIGNGKVNTKGDYNTVVDPFTLTEENYKGKVVSIMNWVKRYNDKGDIKWVYVIVELIFPFVVIIILLELLFRKLSYSLRKRKYQSLGEEKTMHLEFEKRPIGDSLNAAASGGQTSGGLGRTYLKDINSHSSAYEINNKYSTSDLYENTANSMAINSMDNIFDDNSEFNNILYEKQPVRSRSNNYNDINNETGYYSNPLSDSYYDSDDNFNLQDINLYESDYNSSYFDNDLNLEYEEAIEPDYNTAYNYYKDDLSASSFDDNNAEPEFIQNIDGTQDNDDEEFFESSPYMSDFSFENYYDDREDVSPDESNDISDDEYYEYFNNEDNYYDDSYYDDEDMNSINENLQESNLDAEDELEDLYYDSYLYEYDEY